MWTCPECNQKFLNKNHRHSCNEKSVDEFLSGKSSRTIELYHHFIREYQKIGDFVLHPSKSRISFAAKIRFGNIHRLGRDFLDVTLTFNKLHDDNLCFYRIGHVPGSNYYQHYLRIFRKEDINDEVKRFMKLGLDFGNKVES